MLKKLLEGREEEGLLGAGSVDVATRCAWQPPAVPACLLLQPAAGTEDWRVPPVSPTALGRLLERGRKYQEKLAAAQRQAAEAPRDAATGRPLFQPKTHRAPQYERNPEGEMQGGGSRSWTRREAARRGEARGLLLSSACRRAALCLLQVASPHAALLSRPTAGAPIGEYLYSIKAEWDERAERLREARARRTAADAASTYVNTRSEVGAHGLAGWLARGWAGPCCVLPAPSTLARHDPVPCSVLPRATTPASQRMVDHLKRERFTAIFDYLRRGDPCPHANLLEAVAVSAGPDLDACMRSSRGPGCELCTLFGWLALC